MSCREFVVLYTNQKTKKAKKWHDGILKTSSSGNKATLYDDKGLCLDHLFVKFEEIRSGNDFESDRYLITVEEEKISKNEDGNCSGQKEVAKLATTNIMPANLPRCHLPVGLKRKHTGFQGPREISKKPTIEENDTTSAATKSQAPNFSLPQIYATSPLFSTLYTREPSTCSALASEASSCTSRNQLSIEMMPGFSLLPPATLNYNEKLRHHEEIRSFHSTGTGFTYGDCNERISETLQSTTPTFTPGLSSQSDLVRENKRSKAQILALLGTKTVSSSHDLEPFEVKPRSLLVDNGSTFVADNTIGHQQENCFDQSFGDLDEKADPGLIQHCSTESPYQTDHCIKVNLSKSLGGENSSHITEEMYLKCEEKEDSIVQATNAQTVSPEVWTIATVDETLDKNIDKPEECSVKMNSPPRELFSLADDEHYIKPVMPVESDMVDTNSFADINFNILGEFNVDEIGPDGLHGSEIEMLSQTSLSISNSSLKPIEVPSFLKDMEIPEPKHLELETQLPVPQERDSDQILHEKSQTELKPRTVTNAEAFSQKHTLVACEIPAVEIQENRINADESCLTAQGHTITLLKSLSEHRTAIESLEKLNVQNCFKDHAVNKDKAQTFISSEGASGGMIFKNVDLKHHYDMDLNRNYSLSHCNMNRALRIFATEHSLPALRNCLTQNSCAPAKAAACVETFKEQTDNNSLKKMTASDRPLRALQAAEFRGYQVKGSASSDTVVRVCQEELEFEEHFDPFHQVPGSLTADTSFVSPPLTRNSVLASWFQVNSPMQQVPLDDTVVHDAQSCSRDNLHSNLSEPKFSMPTHQPSTSGSERPDIFVNDGGSRIQSAFRLRTPLVTIPTTEKSNDQSLASGSFESLSGIIEPDQHNQCSTIYLKNSGQGDLQNYSENTVSSESMSWNCETCVDNVVANPINIQGTLQTKTSKWQKYQITVSPNSSSCGTQDFTSDAEGMFDTAAFEEEDGRIVGIQDNVNDSFSVELIKDKLIKQHENTLRVNKACSLPIINSTHNQHNVLSNTNHNRKFSEVISLSELSFPRADISQRTKILKRQITIPATFLNPAHYRQVFTAAITEHLNIWLFELSQKLHKALSKVDISNYSSEKAGTAGKEQNFVPLCQHQQPAKLVMVKKEGPNKGRLFYTCDASKANQCKFFKWLDDIQLINLEQNVDPRSKLKLSDAKSLGAFLRSQHISLYSECVLHIRKTSAFQRKRFYHGKVKEMTYMEGDLESCYKTKLYLGLSRKEGSSVYNKDDLWVVSKTLMFDPLDTFIACSVFYGPSSTSEVELLPLKGYSPSKWPSDIIVHALFVGNASTELSCLRNLQEHVNPASLPLLPHLLKMPCYDEAIVKSGKGRFISPALKMPMVMTALLCKERTVALATEMMRKFHLNTDQAAAFRQVAIMMAKGESPQDLILPVTVIHGVYGAGKSYLLAVLILFLVQLFEENDAVAGPRQVPWKLLISASTNVAVDRVLLGLLELGFDRFIRVGSIRKIAKPILPYSLHAGSDNEELRELQALMKEDLTPVEKMHVRKSIEQHKLGRNRAVLMEVRVVGATCAACPFQCMNNLSFPLVLLDECSQITEPVSLLPIARFGCEKLILIGDPKQLPPTIQGSESAHEAGLEQTLFDRMCLMGHNPIMLRTQYRCHPAISTITNELFYNGNLKDGLSASNLNPLLDWLPTLCFYNVKGHDQVDMDGSCHNLEEATFTVKLIQSLIACGIKGSMIGVITLYKSQMHKLCGMLDYTTKCDPAEIKAVHISTVDAFQGAEKEIIILSCVRTRQVGFIDSEKRMNVALTRGKRHLLIVGNLACLRNNRLWKRVIHHCEVRENGLKHAYQCEPELEQIMKCYRDQTAEKGQKNLKSRSKSILPEEGNKVVNTTKQAEGDKMSEVQDCTDYLCR
ncbi:5'-3' DNA helicase ZGRF1-like isoform X2 [Chiloscyllium punctatum]|uniref:5'-3' DNA helicase ZGRF1-like isoform X2 n=1 Tax=Chiloscyllium punctatum TaxID=137246 RepID=UPI003B63BB6F